jgi:hypothetical protein
LRPPAACEPIGSSLARATALKYKACNLQTDRSVQYFSSCYQTDIITKQIMFHRSEKAITYYKELDEARLNGHFLLVPNLARKLQKHDPSKQCILPSTLLKYFNMY